MIRLLALIAGASFVLAVVCFAGAVALGGRDIVSHHWGRDWHVDFDDDGDSWRAGHITTGEVSGAREIAWTGGDTLELDVPADVQFTQAPGPGKLVVTGPKDIVDRVKLSGSVLGLDDGDGDGAKRVSIVMTAPGLRRFALNGDESLSIKSLDADQLDLDISGHGDVKASGKARQTHIDISGDGDVDLSELAAEDADVDINGSGRAAVAPSNAANLRISGSGEVDLKSRPASLSSDVSGSGRIVQSAGPKS